MTREYLEKRAKELREFVEYNNNNGVYRSEFFRLAGESLRETKDEPRQIRRAKATANVLNKVETPIQPYELIGGTIAGLYLKTEVPEYEERLREAEDVIRKYAQNRTEEDKEQARITVYSRIHYHGNIAYNELQKIIEELTNGIGKQMGISRLEISRELERYFNWDFGEDAKLVGELPWEVSNHNDINPPKFLNRGLGDILKEIKERLETETDPAKKEFYESVHMVMEAIINFIKRYSCSFADAAAAEKDAERKAELQKIADAMAKVATEKPETFFEAMQLLWILYVGFNMQACAGTTGAFARFDQYMYPFYKADIEAGRITEEEALLYVCNLFAKINEPKMRVVIAMTIGGQRPDGEDGANDVTKLCLEAIRILRQPYPNVGARIFNGSAEWYYNMVTETMKLGAGNPMILNDEAMIGNMFRGGIPLEDARDYINVGCVETMIMGKVAGWLNIDDVDYASVLLKVLNNGGDTIYYTTEMTPEGAPIITNQKGFSNMPYPIPEQIHTGEPEELDTFHKFMEAYKLQMYNSLSLSKERSDICDRILKEYWFDPYASIFTDDCLEKGMDIYGGGAKYYGMKETIGTGLATAADSIAAIKKFVYDEKLFTLRQMKEMLDANFEGYEKERLLLENQTPCYGNGIEETDRIARTISDWYFDCVDRINKMGIKGLSVASSYSYTSQLIIGEVTPATPNGRKNGDAISNSIAPSGGKDVKGPTRSLNSVTKVDFKGLNGATTVNLKLNPAFVKGKKGTENLKALIKAYFKNMGIQLQLNIVDKETLLDAQEHPEKYNNLIVRVGGYCEYFNNLDRKLQDEVISHIVQDL